MKGSGYRNTIIEALWNRALALRTFLLKGKIGPLGLGSTRKEVEDVVGIFDSYEETPAGFLGVFNGDKPNIQFYFTYDERLRNFHVSTDVLYYSERKKPKTENLLRMLFSDFHLFYQPPAYYLEQVLNEGIRLFYVEKMSEPEFGLGHYYITERNVKFFLSPRLHETIPGATLFYIGCSNNLLEEIAAYEGIEVTTGNIKLPSDLVGIKRY